MSKKPYALIIMDGYGVNERHEGNAIFAANVWSSALIVPTVS